MFVDCAACPVAGRHCATCAVGVVLETSTVLPLDAREARAVDMLASLGLVSFDEAAGAYALRENPRSVSRAG